MENEVKAGDSFMKTGKNASVWVVEKVLNMYEPTHVRLVEQGGNERTMTVSLSTLMDEQYWKSTNPAPVNPFEGF